MKWKKSVALGLTAGIIMTSFLNVEAANMEANENEITKPAAKRIVQTAGRDILGVFAPDFARYNDDILCLEKFGHAMTSFRSMIVAWLGSCWAGLLEMCIFDKYQPLLDLFDIPQDKVISGAVMVGYPLYHYRRLVDRNLLAVNWL